MRVVKVEFQRLLGFKDVTIQLDPELQLVAGPNNAGKSTVVRLLELFFSDPSDELQLAYKPLNDYYTSEGARSLSRVTVHFGRLSPDEVAAFAPIIRQRDGTFSITLRSSRTGAISFEASRKPGAEDARRYYQDALSRVHFVKIPSIRMADERAGDTGPLERLLDTLEAVLVRNGNARSTSLQRQFADAMGPVEALVQGVLNHSAAAIRDDLPFQENVVSFRLPDSRHALRGMLAAAVIESHGAVSLPVAERGTGFQSALVLGILRYVAGQEAQAGGNIFFAIEEPEAFLHPQTQRAMAKILRDISSDAQVLVTTHSSVVVDSFSIERIARLPLQPDGLELEWRRPNLEPSDAGRLNRYCSAANSELVFANAVVFVEGEGDHAVLEALLSRICGGPGGHYSLGITVIEATGVSKIRYLVQLATLFDVRSYVLADRDSLHKAGGQNRELIEILKERRIAPDDSTLSTLRLESDVRSSNLKQALQRQAVLNGLMQPYDAFVLASDLEGLLIDLYGKEDLVAELGQNGHGAIDESFARVILEDKDGAAKLASWMGSKGWNSDGKKSGKLQPHLPSLLIESWLEAHRTPGKALKPLVNWLEAIVRETTRTPV